MGIYTTQTRGKAASFIIMMLIVAFALKALIPAGFMPGSEGGFTKMVICSGVGEKTVMVPSGDAPSPSHDKKAETCAYHLAGLQKYFVALPPVLPGIEIQPDILFVLENDSLTSAKTIYAFAARGPPASV